MYKQNEQSMLKHLDFIMLDLLSLFLSLLLAYFIYNHSFNLFEREIYRNLTVGLLLLDVAVIGLADKRLGEIAAAIIEVKQGYTCTEEDVNNFCLELPKYKRPRKIIFAPVPRNPTGKIEKPKLREMYRTEDPFKVMHV